MDLIDLAGSSYGPVSMRISRAKVAEYVSVTGDEPDRWQDHAPPSYAGALLFVMAPRFLWSPEVRRYTRVLVHSDQRFHWHGPLPVGRTVEVGAEVSKIRARGPMHFVTFSATVAGPDGPLLDSESTFLMSAEGSADPGADPGEPAATTAGPNERVGRIEHAGVGSALPSLAKSASRADLVRYAGASGDYNPIHWDHEAARVAGFEGVIVHGLLMGAWIAQLAAGVGRHADPLADLRLRFRQALRPGVATNVTGTVDAVDDDGTRVSLAVNDGATDLVTGRAVVREA